MGGRGRHSLERGGPRPPGPPPPPVAYGMGATNQPTEHNLQITAGFRSGQQHFFRGLTINLLGFPNQAIHNPSLVDCANAIGTSSTCTIISSVIHEWGIRTFGSGYQNFRVWVPKLLGLGTGRKCVVINLIQPGRLRAFHLCCSLLGN